MHRILIIDDEDDIREVAALSLETVAGWEVAVASSGAQGIVRAAEYNPDAILLDVMMPGMDGIEVLRAVRANPETQGLPVIVFSGVADPEFQAHARQKGANDYWVKGSMDFAHLAKLIASHVSAA